MTAPPSGSAYLLRHLSEVSTSRYASLTDWLVRHDALDEGLCDLRRRVPEITPHAVQTARTRCVGRLRLHLDQEDATLLPAWAERDGEVPGPGTARVLADDHALLRRHLDALEQTPVDDRVARATVLAQLHGVLEHHDAREARYLKPGLDAALPADVVRGWLDRFAAEEEALEASLPPLPPLGEAEGCPPLPDDPIDALRLALAADGPLPAALERLAPRVASAAHPKAARHFDALRTLLEAPAPTVEAHRDALVAATDRARLLALTLGHR